MFRQGDVLLIPIDELPKHSLQEVEKDNGRVVLAYGEATGHAHALEPHFHASLFEPAGAVYPIGMRPVGWLVVDDDEAQLTHEEHAPITLARGAYKVVRQRTAEFDGQLVDTRLVAD